ncbi:MAG: hypothetical protein EXS58_17080 [Candidatus Latescibacteria bacterium]|nr:hypothetical protein [Candidatus Latescibacterota bacterium]
MMRVACVFLLQERALEGLAEACYRFSPQLALGDRAFFIEIGACRRLYSEENLHLRLQALLKRFDAPARIAFADDLPTALALAVYNRATKEQLPIEAIQCYSTPFACRSDSMVKAVQVFRKLGVVSIADFMQLRPQGLVRRFGKEGLLVRHLLENAAHLPWPHFIPPLQLVEAVEVDESSAIMDLEQLLFYLKTIVDRALLRVRGQGRLASVLALRIEQERHSRVTQPKREWSIDLAFPQGAALVVLSIIRERLDRDLQRSPLEAPVRKIEIEVTRTVPGQSRQRDLFTNKEEELESFQSIVARLTDKLGFDRAFLAAPRESHLPERCWRKTLGEVAVFKAKTPPRPLRVLKKPQVLRRIDNYLVHGRRKWKISAIRGPERLSGDWWFGDRERDYYRIEAETGEELWVFTLPEGEEYYLHGLFD